MTQTAILSRCPEASVLSRYVLGKLPEAAADAVGRHIELCPRCQKLVDGLAPQKDSLLDGVRRAGPAAAAEDATDLARLIDRAQQVGPHLANVSPVIGKPGPAETISVDAFVACLRKSGLLEPDEINPIVAGHLLTDSESLARDLVSRKKLTPFQARVLLRGRWKGLVLGNYIILDKLGQGGMSAVFKARHRRMGRVVSLKVPHATGRKSPEIVERFRQEARTVAALKHPNIVVAHDADEADGIPFLVMEFVAGSDLAQRVAAQGPLAPGEAADIVLQAARALDYTHRQGVIHRDIKPHNLLLDESGTVKVLDMGLARFDTYLGQNPDATTHASMTATGVIMGTVDYMAPEQAVNSRLADHRSDIYSLGCTLHFLVTGQVLFAGETLMEKLVAHREQAVPSLAGPASRAGRGLDAVFQRMVAKDPARRYASMAELVRDLEALQAGRDPAALAWLTAEPSQRRRRFVLVGIAGTAGAAIIGLGLWLSRSAWLPARGPDRPEAPVPVTTPVPAPPAPLVGHPETRVNGGPGRVLIVLAHDWFYEDHYTSVEKALKSRGIAVVTASSQPGTAKPKHDGIPPVPVDLTLDRFNVNDFDGIVFVGGNVDEFTHKSPKNNEQVRRMLGDCLDNGRPIAAVDNGDDVLDDAGVTKDCDFQQVGKCRVGRPKGRAGILIITPESNQGEALVKLMLAGEAGDKAPPPK